MTPMFLDFIESVTSCLLRKLSLRNKTRELVDRRSIATRAALLKTCFGHFRERFATSPMKDSRRSRQFPDSTQFSQPDRSTGITQVLMIDLLERGLRSRHQYFHKGRMIFLLSRYSLQQTWMPLGLSSTNSQDI